MHEIFNNDSEMVAFMQRAIGYSLTGSTQEQALFLCYGTGANGKSTLLNVLQRIAGSYAANTPFNTFEHGRQSSSGQELVELRGRRIVLSSETNDNARLNEARIKAITGGDTITGRYLYSRQSIQFKPTFKLWLATNHKPVITGSDDGIWRRIRLLPFTRAFQEHERDPYLAAQLNSELPGILAWAVRGALAWKQHGLGVPDAVQQATQSYRQESDVFGQFLSDCTEARQDGQAPAQQFYERYQQWAAANGQFPMSNKRFAQTMQERGYSKKRTAAGRFYQGIALKE